MSIGYHTARLLIVYEEKGENDEGAGAHCTQLYCYSTGLPVLHYCNSGEIGGGLVRLGGGGMGWGEEGVFLVQATTLLNRTRRKYERVRYVTPTPPPLTPSCIKDILTAYNIIFCISHSG